MAPAWIALVFFRLSLGWRALRSQALERRAMAATQADLGARLAATIDEQMTLAGALQSLEEHPPLLIADGNAGPRWIQRRLNAQRAVWSRPRAVESDWTAALAASRKRGSVILR